LSLGLGDRSSCCGSLRCGCCGVRRSLPRRRISRRIGSGGLGGGESSLKRGLQRQQVIDSLFLIGLGLRAVRLA